VIGADKDCALECPYRNLKTDEGEIGKVGENLKKNAQPTDIAVGKESKMFRSSVRA
jgi:hypothetical protein